MGPRVKRTKRPAGFGFGGVFVKMPNTCVPGPRRRTNENVVSTTTVPLPGVRMLAEAAERAGQYHDQPELHVTAPRHYQRNVETVCRYQIAN